MITRNGRTYYVCDKDCYPRKQWCPMSNCLNKYDFKKHLDEKRSNGGDRKVNARYSQDFKVDLVGVLSDTDFKSFESQFFGRWESKECNTIN